MYKNKTILLYLLHSLCNRPYAYFLCRTQSVVLRRYQLQSWAFVRLMCTRVDVSWKGTKRQHTILNYIHNQAYQKRKNILILWNHLLAKYFTLYKYKCLWSYQRTLSVPFVVHNGMHKDWYLTQSIYSITLPVHYIYILSYHKGVLIWP